jgi:translation initiation factor IF-2
LSKLRVHDLAGEFGISSDEVINLLRVMDVPVRSHLSPLSDDQVARIRARWEREKRARVAAPPAATRRRRGTAAAPAPEIKAEPAPAADASVRRRRRVATEPAPEVVEAEPAALTPEVKASTPAAPPAPASAPIAATAAGDAAVVDRPRTPPPAAPRQPAAPPAPATFNPSATHSAGTERTERHESRDRQRPQPVVPGAPRPRPVATGAPYAPPRPVASAAPGAGTAPPRREDRAPSRGGGEDRGARRGKKGKRGVDQEAVSANIGKTMASMRGPIRRGGARRAEDGTYREEMAAQRQAEVEREKKTVRVNEFITVSELAQILKTPAVQIVGFAFKNLGLMVTINQRLDFDQIELIAGEFGFQAVKEEEYAADLNATAVVEDTAEQLEPRPPVVTIMGHVDHGKTSLLDYIRKSNVVAGESGGITQHIGAYHVSLPGGKAITFLDTPGHEAFTAMRARGAQVTDIVVLVVASDDQVMPQTIEAISHAKNAGVPMIVAINKIDVPGANPMKVKQDLLQHGVVLEEFGGTVLSSEVSAKKGTNIDSLLDQILLQAEILDLKANPNRSATGAVIEAQLDPGKGPVATMLVSNGTLHVGDDFICGMYSGRVRALLDERGRAVKDAGPAIPVQILGIGGVPMAGDQFVVVEDAMESREIAQRRQRLDREAKSRRTAKGVVSLEDFMSQTAPGQARTLRIVIKADQGGPAEALADALAQLSNEEVSVEVIHRGVGAITESDILLARASGAIIVGFHVRPDNNARSAAEREGVEIKLYKIIYEAVEDVRAALEGMLRPEEREVVLGEAEVRELFKVPRMGVIAGCSVRSGVINRTGRVRVIRDSSEIYDGNISSLRRFKDDVKEVREGFECGIGVENFNDIKVGDVLECYKKEQVARTLTSAAGASA